MTVLSLLEAALLGEISEADLTLPDLLYEGACSVGRPADTGAGLIQLVRDTLSRLCERGLITPVTRSYRATAPNVFVLESVTAMNAAAMDALQNDPQQWDRAAVFGATEHYGYQTTALGEQQLALIDGKA